MQPASWIRKLGAAALGALTALAACAALIVGGVFGFADRGNTAQPPAVPVAQTSSKSSGSLADLYAAVKSGVVYVQSQTAQGTASGSGFVIDDTGRIVTNEHVVAGSTDLKVRIGEKGKLVSAQLVGADASKDIAVLKVDPAQTGPLHPLALGSASAVQVGQEVLAIGSPYGLQGTLTSGIVSALDRQIQSPSGQTIGGAVQTDAAINPGNSGGPLLDASGRVIGINAQIATQSGSNSGVGFAISVDTLKQVVPRIESGQIGQVSQQQDSSPFAGRATPNGQQQMPFGATG